MNIICNFFLRKQDYTSYFFFRGSIGLFCFIHFGSIYTDFEFFYSNNGLIPTELTELFKISYIPSFGSISNFIGHQTGWSCETFASFFKHLYLTLCLLLAIGLFTRFSAITLLFLQLVLAKGTYVYAYGVDFFTTIALFYCMVFPVGTQHSIDNHLFKIVPTNAMTFKRVLQLHLCLVYFFSGFDKLLGYNWRNGESVWKAIHLPYYNMDFNFNLDMISSYPISFVVIGWTTICIELLYPIFMLFSKSRLTWLLFIISMHVGILLYLNLYFFSSLMILLNLSAFTNLSTYTLKKSENILTNRLFQKFLKQI